MSDSAALPAPLVPTEVDLRGLEWMPYYGDRLGRSEFNARSDDATWRAGHNLWWAAWNNVPAASLPNDEVALTRFADLGRDVRAFRRLREAVLHGFVLCRDGRLYHPFLADLAMAAWDRRVKEREKKRKWREGKNVDRTGTGPGQTPRESSSSTGTEPIPGPGRNGSVPVPGTDERRGEERIVRKNSDPNGSGAGAPVDDPVKALWDRGLAIIGEGNRSLLGKARREHGDVAVLAAITACESEKPSDPAAFFFRCLTVREQRRASGGVVPMHPGAGG